MTICCPSSRRIPPPPVGSCRNGRGSSTSSASRHDPSCRASELMSILFALAPWCRYDSEVLMAEQTRVVIDCDTGVDDTMAIFYGLLAPHIDVVGISCVWGNIGVDLTTTNTLRLLEMLDRPEIPVARG